MMRKVALALVLSLAFAGGVLAVDPSLSVGGGGMNVLDGSGRDVVWAEPPNLDGLIASSEVIGDLGLESEIATDFVLTFDTSIGFVRWWGGYYNGNGCGEIGVATHWNLRLYDDAGCVPNQLIAEFLAVNSNEVSIGCQAGAFPMFEYWTWIDCTTFFAGNLYWFSAQASSHTFPPQVGRLAAAGVTNCESVFRSAFFGFPDWVATIDVFGISVDFSQRFENICNTPVVETTWGAVKALYR